jgi:hypothetical protein
MRTSCFCSFSVHRFGRFAVHSNPRPDTLTTAWKERPNPLSAADAADGRLKRSGGPSGRGESGAGEQGAAGAQLPTLRATLSFSLRPRPVEATQSQRSQGPPPAGLAIMFAGAGPSRPEPSGRRSSIRDSKPGAEASLFARRTGHKKTLRHRRVFKGTEWRRSYFLPAVPRLNFVVNFSTRPAVSTRRFSPV